jgi:nicotinate phosphoribosyltransferase
MTKSHGDASPHVSPLLTDLYQLAMMEAYLDQGMTETAVFELFVRRLPERRSFLMVAGLEQALEYLETLRFTSEEIAWLASTGRFRSSTLDYLAALRFTGDVHAMPEGTIFFPSEPILRITAPLPLAQLVETRLMNILHYQILVASKAARAVLAAPGKLLVDFGLRRAHGAEAGLMAARASYLAGFAGTATVLADELFGIPSFGTMAHSFIEAHDDETTAFEHFATSRPNNLTFLIDTYDTVAAARKIVTLAPRLKARGISIRSVRIDSGDLVALSKQVRAILDQGGLADVGIFASGGLDEEAAADLLARGAALTGFGLGTALTTSADAPSVDCVYKLQEYAGVARRKHSVGKITWPGRKQVWRQYGADGQMAGDVISLETDKQSGEPLLALVMRSGQRVAPAPSLAESRKRAAHELARLPEPLRHLHTKITYSVQVSEELAGLAAEVDRRLAAHAVSA